jgi:hypothetical protein
MNDHDSRMTFPSGRPIGSIKKDAKKLSKSEGIPLSKALDRLAAENGIPHPWADALRILSSTHTLAEQGRDSLRNVDSAVISAYGPDLIQIRKEAIRQSKAGGEPLEDVLADKIKDAGYNRAHDIATLVYTKLIETTFHVAKAGDTRLQFWVGMKSHLDSDNRRDIYVSGDAIPEKAYVRDPGFRRPSVEWADITRIDKSRSDRYRESDWYVCKYNGNQPRIPLIGVSEKEARAIQAHMGVKGPNYASDPRGYKRLAHSRVFDDLRRYAKSRPRLLKGATGNYWMNWGDIAINGWSGESE